MKVDKRTSTLLSKQSKKLLQKNASPSNKLFTTALAHYKSGQLLEAEAAYRQVLANDPHHADSLHMLGIILGERGQYEEAIMLITRAIMIYPEFVLYHINRG